MTSQASGRECERKPLAAGKFSNSPTYVKFDMRKVPRNAALTYFGEWLLVVWRCAVVDSSEGMCGGDGSVGMCGGRRCR
jgi:hypothetical protein